MSRLPFFVVALFAGALAACAQPGSVAVQPGAVPSPSLAETNLVPDGYSGSYQTVGTVLESPQHGPQLCYVTTASIPPRCRGVDIGGWSWEKVTHETARGSRWGLYLLVGTYDGTRLRLTEPAKPVDSETAGKLMPGTTKDFTSPCRPPAGGWAVVDRATTTDAALQAAIARASKSPGFAGAWIDQNGAVGQRENHPAWVVLNVRFTDDLEAREADLRKVWGGALCVSKARHTNAELERIADELAGPAQVLSSSVNVVANTVELHVYVAHAGRQRELDAKYGAGVVQLHGAMRPHG